MSEHPMKDGLGDEYEAALERDREYDRLVRLEQDMHRSLGIRLIRRSFLDEMGVYPYRQGLEYACRGLAHRVIGRSRRWSEQIAANPAPFGWTYIKEQDRNAALLMPWWVAAFVIIRRDWQHFLFGRILMPMGLWVVDPDGGWYLGDGHPTLPMFVWHTLEGLGVWQGEHGMYYCDIRGVPSDVRWLYRSENRVRPRGRCQWPKWLRAAVWCFLNDRDHMGAC